MSFSDALTRGVVPIIRNSAPVAWDDGKAGPLCIIKMGTNDYRLWYEGYTGTFPALLTKIGYATSSNGTSWTKYGGNPIMSYGVAWENDEVSPDTVIWDTTDSLFKMWYHGGYTTGVTARKIGYATSADGLSWTKYASNPVLSPGSGGSWDDSTVADCSVIKVSNTDYRMWYLGKNASNVQAIGYATSSDGIAWTKYGSNPVFQSGAGGQWDDGTVYGLCVRRTGDGNLHGWYSADDGVIASGSATGVGYASSSNGTTWTRGPNNPVLVGTNSPEEIISDPVWVYEDGPRLHVVYYYDDFTESPTERAHGDSSMVPLAPTAWLGTL